MEENSSDQKTRLFYQNHQVAKDYEKIRFISRAGKAVDDLQKKAILSLINPSEIQGIRLLDVGCGTGRFSRFFSERGADVISIDASPAMLQVAREQDNNQGQYSISNALSLPFGKNTFDVAISVNVFNHLASYEQAISEICRVSRKVILGLPNKYSILFFTYIYRYLRRHNLTDAVCYTTKEYEGAAPTPYSIYFSSSELRHLFEINHMKNIRMTGCLFTFYLPEIATNVFQHIDECLMPYLGQYGSTIIIIGEK